MPARDILLTEGEFYHIYNRAVDRRRIILDYKDRNRFLQYFTECNTLEPIGSIYENSFRKQIGAGPPLVSIVCYALNLNHFHLLLQPRAEHGIERFMHRLGTGFSKYFNHKYHRSGVLFQSRFRSIHVDSNEYLLRVSAYINLNDRAHQLGRRASKLVASSWSEYLNSNRQNQNRLCDSAIILEQFATPEEYRDFAEEALVDIQKNKQLVRELEGDGNLDARRPS